jgi:hypothetical protein
MQPFSRTKRRWLTSNQKKIIKQKCLVVFVFRKIFCSFNDRKIVFKKGELMSHETVLNTLLATCEDLHEHWKKEKKKDKWQIAGFAIGTGAMVTGLFKSIYGHGVCDGCMAMTDTMHDLAVRDLKE